MGTTFLGCQLSNKLIFKLLPALLMMVAIFLFSARSSDNLPMSSFEQILLKGGHVIGYAMLAISYWRAFNFRSNRYWVAWLMAVLFAVSDEFHQSFVPGRHPAVFDVVIYDNVGALMALWLAGILLKQKQPAPKNLVVEQDTRSANG